MVNSIQQFFEDGAHKLTDIFGIYTSDMTQIAEMMYEVTDKFTRLGCSIFAEEWESYGEILRTRKDLRRVWHIVRKDA